MIWFGINVGGGGEGEGGQLEMGDQTRWNGRFDEEEGVIKR